MPLCGFLAFTFTFESWLTRITSRIVSRPWMSPPKRPFVLLPSMSAGASKSNSVFTTAGV